MQLPHLRRRLDTTAAAAYTGAPDDSFASGRRTPLGNVDARPAAQREGPNR
ncbi:hypothetical protein [Streptomyces sp. NPDC002580]|uniref:hypothetical protein n=1 Tax=Streptomyces sp. NPDC002580 TaxID=3364653 RepID=UPI0036A92F36